MFHRNSTATIPRFYAGVDTSLGASILLPVSNVCVFIRWKLKSRFIASSASLFRGHAEAAVRPRPLPRQREVNICDIASEQFASNAMRDANRIQRRETADPSIDSHFAFAKLLRVSPRRSSRGNRDD